jgi:hypothetical protein
VQAVAELEVAERRRRRDDVVRREVQERVEQAAQG